MKKLVMSAAITLAALPLGASADGGAGCGWGSMVFQGQSGAFAHIIATTTNGTSFNQWFGLTTGTAGCDPTTVVRNDFQREEFVASNLDNLSQEMAQGSGDHLDSLAAIMGIAEEDRTKFYSLTQQRFDHLMSSARKGSQEMLSALDQEMLADPALAKYVR